MFSSRSVYVYALFQCMELPIRRVSDLEDLSMLLKKSVYLQLNNIFISFITVLLMQDMRQCFRYDSLYVPATYHSLFIYHFYMKVSMWFCANKYNTIQ